MIKSVCLGLVMVLLLVQLNASHHHHHGHHHMRHHSHRHHHGEHHEQALTETSLNILEANEFFQGYWREITGNHNLKDFNKAAELLNHKYGASKVLEFNQKLAQIHDSWKLTKFAPIWNNWGHKWFSTNQGELASKALSDLFRLTEKYWPIVFERFSKRAPQAQFAGLKQCNRLKQHDKLPMFNAIFGADWSAKFKGYTSKFELNSGRFVGKIVLALISNNGLPFCQVPKPTETKAEILKREAEIKKKEAEIKKQKADILKKEAEIKKNEEVIKQKKVVVQKEEEKKKELKKIEAQLEKKEVKILKEKAKIVTKKAEITGSKTDAIKAKAAVKEAKKAEAKLVGPAPKVVVTTTTTASKNKKLKKTEVKTEKKKTA